MRDDKHENLSRSRISETESGSLQLAAANISSLCVRISGCLNKKQIMPTFHDDYLINCFPE